MKPLENVKPTSFLTGCYKVIDPTYGTDCKKLELDLGCGKGGFSLELATRNPDALVLAADIKASRLKKINNKAAVHKIENIQSVRVLAWDLVSYLVPDNSFDRIHILCPDPWPKTKHRGNKLVTSEFLGRLGKIMKNGSILHLATDDAPYLEWMKDAIKSLNQYEVFDEGIDDVRDIQTEFERYYLSIGKPVGHLSFKLNKEA